MADDYRRTPYEGPAEDVKANKKIVEQHIKQDHAKAIDMHELLRKNDEPYKLEFIKAYGGKCAYCGVSIELIDALQFEIDHFIPYTDQRRFKTKKDAGYMDNLALSCYYCNRKKHEYSISDEYLKILHPDGENIKKCYIRNDEYYIKVNPDMEADMDVVGFYDKLCLGVEMHRLDYLLMRMMGLQEKHQEDERLNEKLGTAIDLLKKKRNVCISARFIDKKLEKRENK